MKPSEALEKAHLLLRGGYRAVGGKMVVKVSPWTQHSYFRSDGSCCLIGAVHIAIYEDPLAPADYQKSLAKLWALRYLENAVDPGPESVDLAAWNDEPGRTLPAVLHILECARALALADGQ